MFDKIYEHFDEKLKYKVYLLMIPKILLNHQRLPLVTDCVYRRSHGLHTLHIGRHRMCKLSLKPIKKTTTFDYSYLIFRESTWAWTKASLIMSQIWNHYSRLINNNLKFSQFSAKVMYKVVSSLVLFYGCESNSIISLLRTGISFMIISQSMSGCRVS